MESYFGTCYETLCREALPDIYEREGVTSSFEVGSYWDTRIQIDVVGLRKDGWTDLGECKWGTTISIPGVAEELEQKARNYPNSRQATIGRRLFVRSLKKGRVIGPESIHVHTLDDLYSL